MKALRNKKLKAKGRTLPAWILLLFSVFGLLLPCFGTESDWFARAWQTDDGLPDNVITGIAQTSDGFLWVGTRGGLVRFDGAEFRDFTPESLPGVINRLIRAVAVDPKGALWVALDRGAVLCAQSGPHKAVLFDARDGLPDAVVSTMISDDAGAIWISYENRPFISTIYNGRASLVEPGDRLSSSGPCCLARDIRGRLWFASGACVGIIEGRDAGNVAAQGPVFKTFVTLDEPVARYGPFVMNTTGEIRQAMIDYQSGRFGQIG